MVLTANTNIIHLKGPTWLLLHIPSVQKVLAGLSCWCRAKCSPEVNPTLLHLQLHGSMEKSPPFCWTMENQQAPANSGVSVWGYQCDCVCSRRKCSARTSVNVGLLCHCLTSLVKIYYSAAPVTINHFQELKSCDGFHSFHKHRKLHAITTPSPWSSPKALRRC